MNQKPTRSGNFTGGIQFRKRIMSTGFFIFSCSKRKYIVMWCEITTVRIIIFDNLAPSDFCRLVSFKKRLNDVITNFRSKTKYITLLGCQKSTVLCWLTCRFGLFFTGNRLIACALYLKIMFYCLVFCIMILVLTVFSFTNLNIGIFHRQKRIFKTGNS